MKYFFIANLASVSLSYMKVWLATFFNVIKVSSQHIAVRTVKFQGRDRCPYPYHGIRHSMRVKGCH